MERRRRAGSEGVIGPTKRILFMGQTASSLRQAVAEPMWVLVVSLGGSLSAFFGSLYYIERASRCSSARGGPQALK